MATAIDNSPSVENIEKLNSKLSPYIRSDRDEYLSKAISPTMAPLRHRSLPSKFTFPNTPRFRYENNYGDFCFGRRMEGLKYVRIEIVYPADYDENNVLFRELGGVQR